MERKGKGRKHIWRRLDRRLMVLISLIVIPVNFLTILLGTLTVREAKGRVLDTYAREFGTYVSREMQLYDRLDEWYKSYILKYRDSMTSSYLFSSVDSINMVNEINAALNVYGVRGFFFLKENAEDEKLYFKGSRGLYGEETERRL